MRLRHSGCAVGAVLQLVLVARAFAEPVPPASNDSPARRTVDEATQGLERRAGLLTLHLDRRAGRVWLELPAPSAPRGEIARYLYVEGLVRGLGSNPVGLDRGQLGPARLIVLRRLGGRVLVEQPNLAFRADSPSALERVAVDESFASSVLWGGEVAAADDDGRVLVDFTPFLVRDAHDVEARLAATKQGEYRLDAARSAVDLDACHVFADNVEFEALLTYASGEPGEWVRSVAPEARSLTLIQHHSIVRLPPPGYRPRPFDPRAGSYAVEFSDYAAPLDRPLERRWIVRHRLRRVDAGNERSPVERPIVYYVDTAIPEPVRSAVLDGARWWARAFETCGFVDAFRVELLPADAHPLDVRYNVIQWVHRSTRGWSYGGGVVDPRTGEMVKGHVSLGSLRVRHDRLLFEGLVGSEATGTGRPDDPLQLALARIRQLAAHEVGHALGLAHNFAASTYGDRASVMDYPAPLVTVDAQGNLDLRRAYGVGVGAWDLHAVRYAYAELPEGADEDAALEAIVREGLDGGLVFLSDADARPAGAAHPLASLWDNGEDAALALAQTLRVRRAALARFGPRNVAVGRPLASLEEVLATVYLHHRYQLEAAAKLIGGVDYRHAVRGDGQPPARPVSPERQRRALSAVLDALDPAELDLPDELLAAIPPRPPGWEPSREQFRGRTAPIFDPLGAAATAAGLAVAALLQPERCTRIALQHVRDPALPSLEEVLEALVSRSFDAPAREPARRAEVRREVQRVVVAALLGLAADARVAAAVRARTEAALESLLDRLEGRSGQGEPAERAQRRYLGRSIRRHLARPAPFAEADEPGVDPPPGSPIGGRPAFGAGGCSRDTSGREAAPRLRGDILTGSDSRGGV